MKNLFSKLSAVLAAFAIMVSCTPEKGEQEHRIAFAQNPMIVMFDSASYDCGLVTDGSWTASSSDSWITVDTPSGSPSDRLMVTLSMNEGDRDRNGYVKVTSGASIKSLAISQYCVTGSGFLSKTSMEFSTYATKENVFVSCDEGWDLQNVTENGWMHLTKAASKIEVNVDDNYSGSQRTASFDVVSKNGSRRAKVKVRQNFSNEKFLASTEYGRRFVYATKGYISSVSSDSVTSLADGVTSFLMTCKYKDDYASDATALQRKIFLFEVNLKKATILATLPDDDNSVYGNSKTQKMTEQIAALAKKRTSLNVIGGINGDFFQVATKPYTIQGVLYRNGTCFKDTFSDKVNTVFAVFSDGTAACLNQSEFPGVKSNIKEAVGGRQNLLENGSKISFTDTKLEPRTCVGVSKDGNTAYLLIVDGRADQYGTGSYGASYDALARLMLAAGAYEAINLDGGGSSTYVVNRSGSYVFLNKPGNASNIERAVFDGLAIVQNK